MTQQLIDYRGFRVEFLYTTRGNGRKKQHIWVARSLYYRGSPLRSTAECRNECYNEYGIMLTLSSEARLYKKLETLAQVIHAVAFAIDEHLKKAH